MNAKEIEKRLQGSLEELAAAEHRRWAHWQSYLHSACRRNEDGSLRIPPDLVEQWERQTQTEYENLTEAEKDSDREQVRKYLPLIIKALTEPD